MLVEIIVGILAVIIPIMWKHLLSKVENPLLESIILFGNKDVQELYQIVMEKIKELTKDGVFSQSDKEEVIKLTKSEISKRGIKVFELMAPKMYELVLKQMLKKALKE